VTTRSQEYCHCRFWALKRGGGLAGLGCMRICHGGGGGGSSGGGGGDDGKEAVLWLLAN